MRYLAREVFQDGTFSNGVMYHAIDEQDTCSERANNRIRSFVRNRYLRQDRSLIVVRNRGAIRGHVVT